MITIKSLADEVGLVDLAQRVRNVSNYFGDRIALKDVTLELTYQNLVSSMNRIARLILRTLDIGTGTIGVLGGHEVATYEAILGTIASGYTYCSLDVINDETFLVDMIHDTQMVCMLVPDQYADMAQTLIRNSGRDIQIVLLSQSRDFEDTPAEVEIDPCGPFVVSFTSGSTGHPKASRRNHVHQMQSISARQRASRILSDDTIAFTSRPGFGASRSNLFTGVLLGAQLVLYDYNTSGIAGLETWIEKNSITYLELTPTAFRRWVSRISGRLDLPRLRYVGLGGEPVTRHDFELFKEHLPMTCGLMNRLGSSEAASYACFEMRHSTVIDGPLVPAGYALDGYKIEIVDEFRRPLGQGKVGSVSIRSSHFLSDTEERSGDVPSYRFVKHGDDITYYSDDMGFMTVDSLLTITGRKDSMTKISGKMVDLLEIEGCLLSFSGVVECVAMVAEREDGFRKIVAFIGTGENEIEEDKLRSYINESLPPIAHPSRFIVLKELPVTTGGKADRVSLKNMLTDIKSDSTIPNDIYEREIREIWISVLGRGGIGIRDHFRDLGGDSLLAVEVVVGIERVFGVNIHPSDLAGAPTIADLAELVRSNRHSSRDSVVLLREKSHDSLEQHSLIIIHGAGGYVGYANNIVKALPGFLRVYGVQAPGMDGRSDPLRSVEDFAKHYVDEIIEKVPSGPYRLCGMCTGGKIAIEIGRLLQAAGKEVGTIIIVDEAMNFPKKSFPKVVKAMVPRRIKDILKRLLKKTDVRTKNALRPVRGFETDLLPLWAPEKQVRLGIRKAKANYKPTPCNIPVLFLRSSERSGKMNPKKYYRRVNDKSFVVVDIPGDHHDLLEGKSHLIVAEKIASTFRPSDSKSNNEIKYSGDETHSD